MDLKQKYNLLRKTNLLRAFIIYPAVLFYGFFIFYCFYYWEFPLKWLVAITAILGIFAFTVFFLTPNNKKDLDKLIIGSNKVNVGIEFKDVPLLKKYFK